MSSRLQFSITVDGIFGERGSVTGPFGLFTTTILFVGGSDHSISHSGSSVAGNFIGCIRGVNKMFWLFSFSIILREKRDDGEEEGYDHFPDEYLRESEKNGKREEKMSLRTGEMN